MNKYKIRVLGAIVLSAFLGMTGCGSGGSDGKDADPAEPHPVIPRNADSTMAPSKRILYLFIMIPPH